MTRETAAARYASPAADELKAIVLTVVVPVYNQQTSIAANVETIGRAIAAGLGPSFEMIVVSDGSIDGTAERVLEAAHANVRVIHYDRNLGKGYAIKVGALEARGRYVAYIDADLDLDPAWLPHFVDRLEQAELDFAIGSKRHPDSEVHYPRARRVYSWLYQQLVRALFRLNVRDTQVGLKVFRREVAEQVLPLLLVKRYAFDLEMLAVGRALGFDRIEELPIRLEYRFSGSGVKLLAVARALVDTAAIFYRLRILRYYQRKQRLGGTYGWTRPRGFEPLVGVISDDRLALEGLDYPKLELMSLTQGRGGIRDSAQRTDATVIAYLEPGGRPAGNWISATVPFLRRGEVAAVVVAKVAPRSGTLRTRAAAATLESRLGGGSLYFRFAPGNLRYVDDFPGGSIVVDKQKYLELGEEVSAQDLPARLSARGDAVIYTPETVIVGAPPCLFLPHMRQTFAYGRRRGRDVRRGGVRAVRRSTLPPVGLLLFFALGPLVALLGGSALAAWIAVAFVYAAAVVLSAALAALSSRSLSIGLLTVPGLVLTHLTYAAGFFRGVVAR